MVELLLIRKRCLDADTDLLHHGFLADDVVQRRRRYFVDFF